MLSVSLSVLNVKCSTTPIFRILLLRYWVSFKVLFGNSIADRQ